MRRTLKAFTLIEMIIVMGILGILMSALMNFYKPIRQTFVDSTMIEDMRTTQTGILNYLTESVRYAEQLVIYDDGALLTVDNGGTPMNITVNTPAKAYEAFIRQNSITKEEDLQRVQVIVINRKDGYSSTGKHVGSRNQGFGGRIITNIINTGTGVTPTAKEFTDPAGKRTQGNTGDSYMVLGGGYYGNSDYAIFIDKEKTYPGGAYDAEHGGLTFVVQTAMTDEIGVVKDGADYGTATVKVSGGQVFLTSTQSAYTMNSPSVDYYLNGNKILPKDFSNSSARTAGSLSPTGTNINAPTANTYIVVLEPDEKR